MDERAKAMIRLLVPTVTQENLIKTLIAESGVSEGRLTKTMWRSFALRLAKEYLAEKRALEFTTIFRDHFKGIAGKYKTRRQQDKARIANRKDQKDKIAFQDAVKAADYESPTDAAHDLHVNNQYKDYSINTLHKWAAIVMKPMKSGRPKKKKEARSK